MTARSALPGPCQRRHGHRLLHTAARLAFSARRSKLHLPAAWPWTEALKAAFEKLAGLCHQLPAVTGFTNKSLRALIAGHLGQDYSQSKMSDDLRRLRLHGLIQRLPRKNTYVLTSDGIRFGVFYTRLQNRLLMPLLDANTPTAKIEIRRALRTLENAVNDTSTTRGSRPQHKIRHKITTFDTKSN